MPGMAPASKRALLHIHDGSEQIERFVQPARAERGAVRTLVPACITRTVDRSIEKKRGNEPGAAHRGVGRITGDEKTQSPDSEVDESPGVAPRHQFLQIFARNFGTIQV